MTQNSFLTECFGASDEVTVNALELQATLKAKLCLECELKNIKAKLELANSLIEARNRAYTVSLDISV